MFKPCLLALSAAFLVAAQSASAQPMTEYGRPVLSGVFVSFPHGGTAFRSTARQEAELLNAKDADLVTIKGRTSTLKPSAQDESLALARALSARSYLIARGVSPLKIVVNFASAADFIADNSTPEGRLENQRVEVELVFVGN